MKLKYPFGSLLATIALLIACQAHAAEERTNFVSIIPDHLSEASFYEQTHRLSAQPVDLLDHRYRYHARWYLAADTNAAPAVPRTGTWALFGAGLTVLGMLARRRSIFSA